MRTALVAAFVLAIAGAARAEEDAQPIERRDAVFPVQFVGSMALAPTGTDGRWGLSIERHPMRGFGVGVGAAAGYAAIGTTDPMRSIDAVWMSFSARVGHYFARRGDAWINGVVGVALAPIVDVTMNGDARLTLTAQPGFTIAVEHFSFGLSMLLGAALVPQPGFTIGVVTGIGMAI